MTTTPDDDDRWVDASLEAGADEEPRPADDTPADADEDSEGDAE